MRIGIIALIVVAATIFSGCDAERSKEPQKTKSQTVVKERSEFILSDLNGTEYKIRFSNDTLSCEGCDKKILLLNFFATWCPPCRAEIPHLSNIEKDFKNDLQIIAVLMEQKPPQEIEKFKKEFDIDYFISISKDNFDFAKKIYGYLRAGANMPIPLSVIFKDGKYQMHYIGAVPEEMIRSDIKNAIGE